MPKRLVYIRKETRLTRIRKDGYDQELRDKAWDDLQSREKAWSERKAAMLNQIAERAKARAIIQAARNNAQTQNEPSATQLADTSVDGLRIKSDKGSHYESVGLPAWISERYFQC